MQVLDQTLRTKLENTVKKAHIVAVEGAKAALDHLGVPDKAAPPYLNDEQKILRRKLRIHGRQLGDMQSNESGLSLNRLVEEVAYEHWHRMLFARFLAENNLLLYPDPDDPVPVSLQECEELAQDENARNGWDLAARFATRMLPQIFQANSPVFELDLPPENQLELEGLLAALPSDVFFASDSIGWVYQYWQADKKKRINDSEVKIGELELPAVTQLFTEPYMVSFLLDNSLGAWWAGKHLTEEDLKHAESEEELRSKASVLGLPLEYLRFVKDQEKGWTPAAGTFEQWPQSLSDFKLLDPCCGSGHFLVAAFHMLVPMRMQEEQLSPKEAVTKVLQENVHGLELDQRCVKIAAFALALAAWTYCPPVKADSTFGFAGSGCTGFNQGTFSGPIGYFTLPELNIACSGLPVTASEDQWLALAPENSKLRNALRLLYEDFVNAPTLGSLLSPSDGFAAKIAEGDEDLFALLQRNLTAEQNNMLNQCANTSQDNLEELQDERREASVMAQGLAKAALLLQQKYTLISTNVPYLSKGKQGNILQNFCEKYYTNSKNNIATVFLERCLKLCSTNGSICIVTLQDWLFQSSYKNFRKNLLKNYLWNLIVQLGPKAFSTSMWDFNVQLLIISYYNIITTDNIIKKNTNKINILDLYSLIKKNNISDNDKTIYLQKYLKSHLFLHINQSKQLTNNNYIITISNNSEFNLLNNISHSHHGLVCGDRPRMCFNFWEINNFSNIWIFYCGTVSKTIHFGGKHTILRWCNGLGAIKELKGATNLETHAWDKKGVVVSAMNNLPVDIYTGMAFDNNTSVITANDEKDLPAIWCFCSSPEYRDSVRQIDQSLKVTNATLAKVPFDLERWQKVAQEKYPNGLPKPYSDDPTQWIFHGHPCRSVIWDEEQKKTVPGPLRCDATVLHVAVARLLGYQWPAELDANMELAEEQRDLVGECAKLASHTDFDGIVCIPAVSGEQKASERLLALLIDAYGNDWSSDVLDRLLEAGQSSSLERWLRDKFFAQHCKLFQNRPFIWHIWDGREDGFGALVNYHKLTYKKLEALTYTYLGNWIARQTDAVASKEDGAQERLVAAQNLQKELELILQGENPYDIFVRWKAIHEQPIGWHPDLNDGVRLNIRPFLSVPDVRKKGAGVLHDKPNIKWDKDRGKDTEKSPWYHLFNGNRINDWHLGLAEKQKAREEEEERKTKQQSQAALAESTAPLLQAQAKLAADKDGKDA